MHRESEMRTSLTAYTCVALAAILFAFTAVPVHAQSSDFTPVTDAMLQDPAPEDWLMWRRTLDGWGYSPLDQIDRDNVGRLRMVWSRGLGPGLAAGDAARLRRRHVHAESARRHPGPRRSHRRCSLGVTGATGRMISRSTCSAR